MFGFVKSIDLIGKTQVNSSQVTENEQLNTHKGNVMCARVYVCVPICECLCFYMAHKS